MTGLDREQIAMRVARELHDRGANFVNLGIGLPTLVANFVPYIANVTLQAENGLIGYGPLDESDPDCRNAGGQMVCMLPGASVIDSADAFGMIRGGHLDVAVLGGLEVSEYGDLANWLKPGRGIGSIGGAMDLATGVPCVIVAMEHTTRHGHPRIVKECSVPVTGRRCVNLVVTNLAVLEPTAAGMVLRELAPGVTIEHVQSVTEPTLIVYGDVPEMTF